MKGAPMSSTVEKMAAMASARRNAWKTRASARSRRAAPSARATAAVGRLQDHHHPGKRQRSAGERVRSEATEKKSVEGDHACEREQVEDVRRCQAQQCRQDRALEQKLGARCGGGRDGLSGSE